jgi:hypothetical protein
MSAIQRRLSAVIAIVVLSFAGVFTFVPRAEATGCSSHYAYHYTNSTTRHWTGNRVWNGSMYVKVTWVERAGPGYWYNAYQLIYAC